MNNVQPATTTEGKGSSPARDRGEQCPKSPKEPRDFKLSFIKKTLSRHSSLTKSTEQDSISVERAETVDAETASTVDSKNNRSLFSRLKQLTDRFGLSIDRDQKQKSAKNNNSTRAHFKSKKKPESPCCNSLENVDSDR